MRSKSRGDMYIQLTVETPVNLTKRQQRGDMYIQLTVETPVNLTKRQQQLLKDFEGEAVGEKTSPESEGFFSRVKEFWEDLTE